MKVIVADKISERGVELLRSAGWNIVVTTKDTLNAEIADADALIVRSATKVTPDLLEKARHLRVVGRAGVGVDNIDLEEATRRGVLVMSTPGGNAVSVAEHTFALLLALAKQVPRLDKAIHEGRWEKSSAAGTEVRGKTLGLIGLGRIGSEVAVRAEAFDMRVLGYDPYISEAAAREVQVELVPLERLLAESDFVSLHTALSPATQNLINAKTLAQMKTGARLVNAARGELIDEAALAEALKSGKLAGAALDVFVEEPPKNSPLTALPNVIAPQVAAARRLAVEEETRRREHGFPNTLEVSALPDKAASDSAAEFTVEGTVLHDGSPRVLQINGIPVESQLEGTILYLRNRDEPGVIGQVGSTLGQLGVNIATFALGRRQAAVGAEAVALVRLDGTVSSSILEPIGKIRAITEARLLHL